MLTAGALVSNSQVALDGDQVDFTGRANRTIFTLGVTASQDVVPVARNMAAPCYRSHASGLTNTRVIMGIENTATDGYDIWDYLNGWIWASGVPATTGVSKRLNATYNGSTSRTFYVNGAPKITDNTVNANSAWDTYPIDAEDTSRAETWDGLVAYAYARPEALSAAYLAAEYFNLNMP